MLLAGLTCVVMFSLNGEAGNKYGIPYLIQSRASFGMRGSKIVEFLRALPAIAWYGIGTWIAALSLDGILKTLTGFTAPLDDVHLLRRAAGRCRLCSPTAASAP